MHVWSHINAVQEANRQYDNGVVPKMLVEERFDRVFFKDVVDAIFATDSREKAEQIIEDHSKMFMTIIGTRGATGKKTVNASTHFGNLFDIGDSDVIDEEPEMSEDKLDALEETL